MPLLLRLGQPEAPGSRALSPQAYGDTDVFTATSGPWGTTSRDSDDVGDPRLGRGRIDLERRLVGSGAGRPLLAVQLPTAWTVAVEPRGSHRLDDAPDWCPPRVAPMVRPGSWTRPAGASPARVIAGEPGSRPRSVAERCRAERGVESLFGGSKRVGRSATQRESCSLVTIYNEGAEPLISRRRRYQTAGVSGHAPVRSLRGRGIGTHARPGSEQERPVCAASSAKTPRISQW
jgi:hypothetical protein